MKEKWVYLNQRRLHTEQEGDLLWHPVAWKHELTNLLVISMRVRASAK